MKGRLSGASLLGLAALAGPAWAQSVGTPADDQPTELEEVVVTAEPRDRFAYDAVQAKPSGTRACWTHR